MDATSEDVFSLSSGSYFVMLTDSNGCTTTSNTYVITEPTQIQNIAVVTPVSCFGGNDGITDITVTVVVFLYILIYGVMVIPRRILVAYFWNVSVETTDNNGCSSIDSIFVMQPSVLSASLTSNNGGLSGLASGGTLPYTYDFYGPSGLVASTSNN